MPMRAETHLTLKELFLAKVEQTDHCWLWRGSISPVTGYGRLQFMNKSLRAHRVAYELLVGPIPKGMEVCHNCDNPPCQRPDHFFLGTTADNLRDMTIKGRSSFGERNGRSKLGSEAVREIRRLYATGEVTQQQLAGMFGVEQITISNITTRKTWQRVP